jgi:hypothetical protein
MLFRVQALQTKVDGGGTMYNILLSAVPMSQTKLTNTKVPNMSFKVEI